MTRAAAPPRAYIGPSGIRQVDAMPTQPRSAKSDGAGRSEDWPHLFSFGTLLAAVIGVLLLGAMLRTEAPEAQIGRSEVPTTSSGVLVAGPSEAPHAALDRLAQRARADAGRLGSASDEWTAQLGLFCDPARVWELFEQFGDLASLHILPSLHRDQACFRICWGQYRTAAEAKAARDLPESLRRIVPSPLPKPVDELLE